MIICAYNKPTQEQTQMKLTETSANTTSTKRSFQSIEIAAATERGKLVG